MTGDQTGGSAITSYVISWDLGLGGAYTDLTEVSDLQTSQIFLAGITSGAYYNFVYRAKNTHGDGIMSDPVRILAATVPI